MISTSKATSCVTVGIDGCRAGWALIHAHWQDGRALRWQLHITDDLDSIWSLDPKPAAVAIDMPIGLTDSPQPGGRECDRMARKLLGRPRASSVFSPPSRPLLNATHFDEVRGKGLTIQGFHLIPKILEVDQWITPQRQATVFEAHPELAFYRLTGQGIAAPKRRRAGKLARIKALSALYANLEEWLTKNRPPANTAGIDDVVDALIMAWVAQKYALGTASVLPQQPPRDARGLQMAIWS